MRAGIFFIVTILAFLLPSFVSAVNYEPNISLGNAQIVTISETTSIKGIATNGSVLFVNNGGSSIKVVHFNGSVIRTHTISGLGAESGDITHASGNLYIRNSGTSGNVYMINFTSNTTHLVSVDSSYSLLTGNSWGNYNLLDMPDGRIGTVSNPTNNPFTLRLYTISANGTSFMHDEDINISESWNTDNHGFSSDGNFLTMISYEAGHKVYDLSSGEEHYDGTSWNIRPSGIGNPTFTAHDHLNNRIVVGDYSDSDFIIFNDTQLGLSPLLISACGNLTISGGYYNLTQNVSSLSSCFTIMNHSITIDGKGYLINYSNNIGGYGINNSMGFDNTTIVNVTIRQGNSSTTLSNAYNIYFDNDARNVAIYNSTIVGGTSSGDAVYLSNVSTVTVTGNNITGRRYGLRMISATNGIFSHNLLGANSINAFLTVSSTNNTFIYNNLSVGSGIWLAGTSNNANLSYNNITSNNNHAVRISTSSNVVLHGNILRGGGSSSAALHVESSNHNTFYYNNITSVAYAGIEVNAAVNNTFAWNNIISNTNRGIFFIFAPTNNTFISNNINGTQAIYYNTPTTTRNYLIYENDFGKIEWIDSALRTNLTVTKNISFPGNIRIENSSAFVNSSWFGGGNGVNTSANVTLYNIGNREFSPVLILKDGVNCGGACYNFTSLTASTVIFNVSSWSNYSIGTDTVKPYFTGLSSNDSIVYGGYWEGVDFNATDETTFGTFIVNNSLFTINSSGFLNSSLILGAGSYGLNISINDSANNVNSTIYFLTVNQTNSSLNLTFEGQQGNYARLWWESVVVNGSLISGDSDGRILLYFNGTLTNNASREAVSTVNFSSAGNYTVTAVYENSQNYSSSNLSYIITANPDEDLDGYADDEDNLYGNKSYIQTTGISDLNVTIGGSDDLDSFSDAHEVVIRDGLNMVVNFSHNFSSANLNLSRFFISKSSSVLFVNFSNQLQGNKTLYFDDNDFTDLCVKDMEISEESEITSDCSGENETAFDSCLGSSASIGGIDCVDTGTVIVIENLQNSGVRGSTANVNLGSGGGSSKRKQAEIYLSPNVTCESEWSCTSWSFCSTEFTQARSCVDLNGCENATLRPEEARNCPDILFDTAIDLQTRFVFPWRTLSFDVNLKEVNANELVDVKLIYRIEKDNVLVYEESETVAVQNQSSFRKKIEELDLPPGEYSLFVVVEYGKNQTASAQQNFSVLGITSIIVFVGALILIIGLIFVGYNWRKTRKEEVKIEGELRAIRRQLKPKSFYDPQIEKIEEKRLESISKTTVDSLKDSDELINDVKKDTGERSR